ncbi:MAG: hypothetical protein QNJ12_13570 [Ilumatobacter sp.]|uniref:hypothetical protein n=1 Tax=Ilumatobacter sp. TaxID=1967498 RepID=UPI002635F9F6|nr:hypothetical protein [Ilumatobacter sp.]MDJ0769825.1 hypothetical protein [Ilumatobacter sp.]
MAARARLVIGDAADDVRRSIGATSWAALELLASRAVELDGNRVVTASIRDIGDELGVAKNTSHRAVRRLVVAGLVAPVQERSTDGRFLAGTYRLTVPADVLHPVADQPSATTRANRRTASKRRHHSDDSTQLSLLTP